MNDDLVPEVTARKLMGYVEAFFMPLLDTKKSYERLITFCPHCGEENIWMFKNEYKATDFDGEFSCIGCAETIKFYCVGNKYEAPF